VLAEREEAAIAGAAKLPRMLEPRFCATPWARPRLAGLTSLATIAWLIAWGVLHARWAGREVAPGPVWLLTLALTGLGILGTFPPVWAIF